MKCSLCLRFPSTVCISFHGPEMATVESEKIFLSKKVLVTLITWQKLMRLIWVTCIPQDHLHGVKQRVSKTYKQCSWKREALEELEGHQRRVYMHVRCIKMRRKNERGHVCKWPFHELKNSQKKGNQIRLLSHQEYNCKRSVFFIFLL